MNDRVAVRAYGDKVTNWVKFVFPSDLRERHYVMHVNETLANRSIRSFKVEIADGTESTIVFDTSTSSLAVALKCID